MRTRTLIYIGVGLVLLVLLIRKAPAAGGGGANNAGVNADMGGLNFGADPTAGW